MLTADSHNNVFGHTKNAVRSHLTAGGSSGGEGSVIAFRGSALGIGTDVGGSVRIPAYVNGVYGYKPSVGVLSILGFAASNYSGLNSGIMSVCGPITLSFRDMVLLTKIVRTDKPWLKDPSVIPMVMETPTATRRPVVGIIDSYESCGLTPHPPVRRAISEARAKLEAAGYKVKTFTPVDYAQIRSVTSELFTLDGLSYAKGMLENAGEPPTQSVLNMGYWHMERKSMEQYWEMNNKKLGYQKEMLDRWQAAGLDVLITPVSPYSALGYGSYTSDHYTVPWNAFDVSVFF